MEGKRKKGERKKKGKKNDWMEGRNEEEIKKKGLKEGK
jgi:hypothetical protein